MITAFIFTRNRAAQCHLLLESMQRNLTGVFEPYLLYRSDTPEFGKGYKLLAERMGTTLPAGNFVPEFLGPRGDLLRACEYAESTSGYIALFTDDCVVWRKANIHSGDIETVLKVEKVKVASLRLGQNTVVQDYLTGREQPKLETAKPVIISPFWGEGKEDDHEDWLGWEYERFGYTDNFGYVAGMDGVVFRAAELKDSVLKMERMDTYRAWEGCWHQPARRAEWSQKRPWIAAPEVSCVVNIPANSVQADPTPSGQRFSVSVEELNHRYLNGEVIDLDQFDFSDVRSCHREWPYKFRRL